MIALTKSEIDAGMVNFRDPSDVIDSRSPSMD